MQTTQTISLKERQRREREDLIIQAAQEVLLEKGYYETSMDEIAARVGIAKGTIYTHFPGKEELVLAIFQRNMQHFLDRIAEIVEKDLTPRGKLEEIMTLIYSDFFGQQTQLISSIYNGVDIKRMLVEKSGCMKDMWHGLADNVSLLLEQGKQAGEFDSSIPTAAMLYSFFCNISPKAYERLIVDSNLSHQELVTHLQRIYFNGIAAHAQS
jgi:TetR/AcrR family transcriptional regulator, fatty acid metabolism regulator protein